jgi:competence protein ComEA
MQRHHRDLLTAIAAVMFLLLALLGWSALSRLWQSPTMSVARASGETPPAPAVPIPQKPSPPTPPGAAEGPASASTTLRIHIVGAVRKSAVYNLPANARVDDAVKLAGGTTADADLERINLADFLKDGEQVRIPRKSERPSTPALAAVSRPAKPPAIASPPSYRSSARYPLDASVASRSPADNSTPTVAAAPATTGGKVNLNTATAVELDDLPGVGPATAAAILDFRRQHGRFLRIEDILEVRGIGEKKFEKMKERLTIK